MTTLKFDSKGLIPAISQDQSTGQIRMMAWMNKEALSRTLETGVATFFSRSRNKIWVKGESSGNTMAVSAVYADCDEDTLIVLVKPAGPSCHTGRPTCFFRRLDENGESVETEADATSFLYFLEAEIAQREKSTADKSYTRYLLEAGAQKIGEKLREEADELSVAIATEDNGRVASEAADVLYHLMVALRLRGVALHDVIKVLESRAGVGGHGEKANRSS